MPQAVCESTQASHGIWACIWAGLVKVINPPHMQVQVETLSKAGMPPSMTVEAPGAQGATVFGTQGIGVNTPKAAAVAAATVGLAGEMQTPNVGMFTIGLLSMMLAAGVPIMVLLFGSTLNAEGAAPKLHIIIEPAVINIGIARSFCWLSKMTMAAGENREFFLPKVIRSTRSVRACLLLDGKEAWPQKRR